MSDCLHQPLVAFAHVADKSSFSFWRNLQQALSAVLIALDAGNVPVSLQFIQQSSQRLWLEPFCGRQLARRTQRMCVEKAKSAQLAGRQGAVRTSSSKTAVETDDGSSYLFDRSWSEESHTQYVLITRKKMVFVNIYAHMWFASSTIAMRE